MFKNLIGRGHPEFSGKQQQDAQVSSNMDTFYFVLGKKKQPTQDILFV